jgi:hypothetical protein
LSPVLESSMLSRHDTKKTANRSEVAAE